MSQNNEKQLNKTVIINAVAIICLILTLFMTGIIKTALIIVAILLVVYGLFTTTKVEENIVNPTISQSEESHQLILTHASHDMRTPMNAIINFSSYEFIKDSNPKELMAAMAAINDSGHYMLTLINDLFTLTGMEDDANLFHNEATTIASCIEPPIEMMRLRFEAKHQIVNVNYHNVDKYRYVDVDPQRIRQILMNLLSNANKYTNENGFIDIMVEGEDVEDHIHMTIHVKDNGMGIAPSKLNAIKKAYREKRLTNKDVLGLGFSTIFTLINAMHGEIDILSEEGNGTECIVTLDWPVSNGPEESTYDFSILEGKNVLLVEDNVVNAEITKVILENKGMTMDLASNGQQGVAMFTHAMPHTYDLILMDVKMPIMDGLEATRTIRGSNHPEAAQIPIIAMTAEAFENDRERSFNAGMNDHIIKPIVPEELYKTLSNFLSRVV